MWKLKNTWINYDVLKEKWFRCEDKPLVKFLEDEWIKKYSKANIANWVKDKKEYLKKILEESVEKTDEDIKKQLDITTNKLLEWKVKILNTLLKRVDNITESVDKKVYNWFTTQELIQINSLIKTELWEASEIKKIEWWTGWFSIVIIPNDEWKK